MKLLVTTFIKGEGLEKLKKYFDEIRIRGLPQISRVLEPEKLIQEIQDIDVFIVEFEEITEKVLARSKHLKLIASVRAGPQANIDIAAATRRGIPVLYSPGRSSDVVADFTMGLLLAATRYIAKGHFLVKTRKITESNPRRLGFAHRDVVWVTNDPENFPYLKLKGIGLTGKTLGILGLGAIGKEVARRAVAFKMNVIAHDPYVSREDAERIGVRLVDKDTLFRQADFVSIHVKVEPKTLALVGKRELELMKPTAFLINTARGAIVDQKTLCRILKKRRIAGAALDVFENEPLKPSDPLLDLDNVVLTPHIAGACYDNYEKASSIVTRGIEDYLKGVRPHHVVNPDVLDKSKVGRLLQKAREDGVVSFQVLGPTSNCLEIEKKLIDLFNLQDAVVVPVVSEDKIRESLARAAAQYLERHLTSGSLFAVGWGITISEVPKFIHSHKIHNLRIVTLNGGLTPSYYLNPYDVGSRLAYIFGGQCYYVHAPAITTSDDLCRSLKADATVQQALEMAKHADYSMVGIGVAGEQSTLVKLRYLNLGETEALRQQGAVGDILGQFFNARGEKVDCDLHKRIVAFPIEDLRKMENVIGLAGGKAKAKAILGAIRGRFIKILITDEGTAKDLLILEGKVR